MGFFAFTPHAHWHDVGHYENNIEHKWLNGFAVTPARWPEVLRLARESDAPGRFATIAGCEWHSSSLGDYHVLFADLEAEPVTGDRIALDFTLNGRVMGQELPYAREREIQGEVTGWHQADRVEVLKTNRIIHRDFPMDREPSARRWEQSLLIRFEFGWGPWSALGITRVCDWDLRIELEGGALEAFQSCFQPGPLEEDRRDRVLDRTERGLRVISFTALRQIIDDVSTKAVVLRARGGPETRLTIALTKPVALSRSWSLKELAESSEVLSTGPFPKESALVHRLVFQDHYCTSFRVADQDAGSSVNRYYLRAVPANGQLAWSSPIWVERGRSSQS